MTPVLRMASRGCAPAAEAARAAARRARMTRSGRGIMRGMIHPAYGRGNWTLVLCPRRRARADNRGMKSPLWVLLAALAACAAPEPWQKDGATPQQLQADSDDCRSQARTMPYRMNLPTEPS